VTVTGPWGMTATFSVTAVDVAAHGDSTTALSVAVTSPAGSRSGLVGVVTEGSRAMMLAQTNEDGAAPDQAAFAALLDQAADAAAFR
jgi:exo-beta-1,3-glucanase (GH17 family)